MKGYYTKEEVNRAIFEVLNTPYKKDCKEYHTIVETAGYRIIRNNGWEVKNNETGKYVYFTKDSWDGTKRIKRMTNLGKDAILKPKQRYYRITADDCKFDFVACLDCTRKPYSDWYDAYYDYRSEAVNIKYQNIRYEKNKIQWRDEDIKKIQGQIANLEKQLMDAVERKCEAKVRLKELRKEYGLKER